MFIGATERDTIWPHMTQRVICLFSSPLFFSHHAVIYPVKLVGVQSQIQRMKSPLVLGGEDDEDDDRGGGK